MHVLHVYKDYPPVLGGIEHHLQLLAEGQAAQGMRVTVLVTARGPRTSVGHENGVEVIRAGRLATAASTPLSPALFHHLRRLTPDLTHLQLPYPWGAVGQLLTGRGRPLVVSYQSDIVRQRRLGRLYRPLQERLLARADRILVSSEAYLASSPTLARHRERCTVVPLGIDTARFAAPSPDAVADLRARWPGALVLFVGRLRYYKGLEHLIDAMAGVEAQLLIAGRGRRESALRRLAQRSPAAGRIVFLGDIPPAELAALYAAADVFVLPSAQRSEAFGIALVEAMAAGTPVVSTELGTGTSFVNQHGETGLVVPPADGPALAAALNRLLVDPDLRAGMGQRAGQRAVQCFGRDVMLDRIAQIYTAVV